MGNIFFGGEKEKDIWPNVNGHLLLDREKLCIKFVFFIGGRTRISKTYDNKDIDHLNECT